MIVIADAGPLILLEASGIIALLPRLYGEVLVPRMVASEVQSFDVANHPWIRVVDVSDAAIYAASVGDAVDAGEASGIALAMEHPSALHIIDDRDGRKVARDRGVRITGSVGVVLLGKERGLIPLIRPVLDEFMRQHAWLSNELLQHALEVAGEGSIGPPPGPAPADPSS